MLASSGHVQAENRVPGSSSSVASETGFSAIGCLDFERALNDEIQSVKRMQHEGESNCTIAEDGVSPDNAPEFVCDDLNDEVRDQTVYGAMHGLNRVNGNLRARLLYRT
jgi:hypothetical protein